MNIPKKIFYVWFGHNELPQFVINNIHSWKRKNPQFKIIRIDEKNFDINKYDFVKSAYKNKNWAYCSDVARLDVIYNNGGFYFDTDSTLIKPIECLTKYNSIWAMENSGAVNSGLILGAQKGDKDIKNILDIYKHIKYNPNDKEKYITTNILSNYFLKKGLKFKNKTQILKDGQYIFSSEYFAPYHWWGGGKLTSNTIGIQQYANSWGADMNISTYQKIKYNIRLKAPFVFIALKKLIKHQK